MSRGCSTPFVNGPDGHGHDDVFRFRVQTLAVALLIVSCHSSSRIREYEFAGEAQGTTYSVKVVTGELSTSRETAIRHAIGIRLEAIDRMMSAYRSDSELSRFNRFHETLPFKASPELIEVVQLAAEVSAVSDGAFDITVAPLVEAWGFGPAQRSKKNPPSDDELATLCADVGYAQIEASSADNTLRKTRPGVQCDLNGIAQGYTVDKLAAGLEAMGYGNYVVELGGEVKAHGVNERGAPWRIGLEKPLVSERSLDQVISPGNKAVSTSGDYRNYYESDGVRISHTIDPHTGRPIAHPLAAVTVIHDSCALADAYATALMVLGPGKGYALAQERGLAARFITHSGPDAFIEKASPAFAQYAKPAPTEGRNQLEQTKPAEVVE